MQMESFHWLSHHGIIEPLYHDLQIYLIFWAFLFLLWSSFLYFGGIFNKTIIPLVLVGYEMIIANSALRTLLGIYHLISNACSWNNC